MVGFSYPTVDCENLKDVFGKLVTPCPSILRSALSRVLSHQKTNTLYTRLNNMSVAYGLYGRAFNYFKAPSHGYETI